MFHYKPGMQHNQLQKKVVLAMQFVTMKDKNVLILRFFGSELKPDLLYNIFLS